MYIRSVSETYSCPSSSCLTLYMVIIEVTAAGTMMIGIRLAIKKKKRCARTSEHDIIVDIQCRLISSSGEEVKLT